MSPNILGVGDVMKDDNGIILLLILFSMPGFAALASTFGSILLWGLFIVACLACLALVVGLVVGFFYVLFEQLNKLDKVVLQKTSHLPLPKLWNKIWGFVAFAGCFGGFILLVGLLDYCYTH